MPHARLGEGVCAWLIPTDAARDATHDGQMLPDRDMIADFVASRGLARQKLPERIEWVDDFPARRRARSRSISSASWSRNSRADRPSSSEETDNMAGRRRNERAEVVRDR
ncbi:hypothetical protein ACFQ4K_30870 [Tistrella bauzanensis]